MILIDQSFKIIQIVDDVIGVADQEKVKERLIVFSENFRLFTYCVKQQDKVEANNKLILFLYLLLPLTNIPQQAFSIQERMDCYPVRFQPFLSQFPEFLKHYIWCFVFIHYQIPSYLS